MEMDVNILQLQLLVLSIAIFTASDAKKGNSIFSLTSIFKKLINIKFAKLVLISKISDTFVDCSAGMQKKTCTGAIDFPSNPKYTIIDCEDDTKPQTNLNTTSSQGYIRIKNCEPGGKSFTKMLQSLGVRNDTTTHLIWYQKSTGKKNNLIPSDTSQIKW